MLILAFSIANTVSISLKLIILNFERKKVTIIKVQHFSDKQNEILLFGNVNRKQDFFSYMDQSSR